MWSVGTFQLLLQLISSIKSVFFTEIPHQPLTYLKYRYLLTSREMSSMRFFDWHWKHWRQSTPKRKCRKFDKIVVAGCTESCQNDNFQCRQMTKFHQKWPHPRFSQTELLTNQEAETYSIVIVFMVTECLGLKLILLWHFVRTHGAKVKLIPCFPPVWLGEQKS